MKKQKCKALNGSDNKRLYSTDSLNSTITAPLNNHGAKVQETHRTIPNVQNVLYAKEWVDDGSKL